MVEKLDLHEYGFAPRFLHIDGDWRDHRLYAITKEEVPLGLLAALRGVTLTRDTRSHIRPRGRWRT